MACIKGSLDIINNQYSEEDLQTFIDSKEFEEKLHRNMSYIIMYQDLSEEFLYRNNLVGPEWFNWVVSYQKLSEEFLIKYIDKLHIYKAYNKEYDGKLCLFPLCDNKKIPEDVKNRIIDLKKVID